MMHPRVIILVWPGVEVWTNSQDLIAKKKAAINKSIAWSSALFMTECDAVSARQRKNAGVMAFCTFLPTAVLSIAFSCLSSTVKRPSESSPCR